MEAQPRRVLFCFQCHSMVPTVLMPFYSCAICSSLFVDEMDISSVPPEGIRDVLTDSRWNGFRAPDNTPSWAVQGGPEFRRCIPRLQVRNNHRLERRMRIPLPPVQRRQPQLFVAPDGTILDRPPNNPEVPSEAEVERRRAALQIRPCNPLTDGDVCSICLDEHAATVASSQRCVHGFHRACYERWLEQKNKCPLCQVIVAP